jgi:aspartate aminotransferase
MTIDASHYFAPRSPEQDLNALTLSDSALGMRGSKILAISYAVRERIAKGAKVTQFTVGDFAPKHFPVPELLSRGSIAALEQGHTNYPPADGMPELRKAIRDYYERELGLSYPLDSVVVGSGARPVLYATYRCLINPGERVLTPAPGWNNDYFCQLVDAEQVEVPCDPERGFMPTASALRPHIGGARLLVICSPMNPTGTLIRREQLEEICDLILEENARREASNERLLYLVYDHVYWMLTFGAHKHITPPEVRPAMARYTIFSDAISKSFAGTGLRVGWMVAPPHITASVKALMTHVGAWAPRPEQLGTAALLNDPAAMHAFMREFKGKLQARLDALYEAFMRWKREGLPVDAIEPQGAMYLSVKVDLVGREGFPDNDAVRVFLLERADCAVIPFDCFGDTQNLGWMRFSVGAVGLDEVAACLPKIEAALRALESPK